jgi:hypothetical protein
VYRASPAACCRVGSCRRTQGNTGRRREHRPGQVGCRSERDRRRQELWRGWMHSVPGGQGQRGPRSGINGGEALLCEHRTFLVLPSCLHQGRNRSRGCGCLYFGATRDLPLLRVAYAGDYLQPRQTSDYCAAGRVSGPARRALRRPGLLCPGAGAGHHCARLLC